MMVDRGVPPKFGNPRPPLRRPAAKVLRPGSIFRPLALARLRTRACVKVVPIRKTVLAQSLGYLCRLLADRAPQRNHPPCRARARRRNLSLRARLLPHAGLNALQLFRTANSQIILVRF